MQVQYSIPEAIPGNYHGLKDNVFSRIVPYKLDIPDSNFKMMNPISFFDENDILVATEFRT